MENQEEENDEEEEKEKEEKEKGGAGDWSARSQPFRRLILMQ